MVTWRMAKNRRQSAESSRQVYRNFLVQARFAGDRKCRATRLLLLTAYCLLFSYLRSGDFDPVRTSGERDTATPRLPSGDPNLRSDEYESLAVELENRASLPRCRQLCIPADRLHPDP